MVFIFHANGVTFDSYSSFPLQIHAVQNLGFHLFFRQGIRFFQQAICKRGFTVIDVSYNTKVANMSRFHPRKLQSKGLGL